MSFVLRGGRVIDPAAGTDAVRDVFVAGDRVVGEAPADAEVVDCAGCVVAPGFVDLHASLAHPGHDGAAAAAGGFTTVALAVDHPRKLDGRARVERALRQAESAPVRVLGIGALTRGLEGEELAELGTLLEAGCVALSNGTAQIPDTRVLRHALEYTAKLGALCLLRPGEAYLEEDGVIAEGPASTWLGLPAVPAAAEAIGVVRLAELARLTGARVHLTHLWSAAGIAALRAVHARGIEVTASTTAHHLALDPMTAGLSEYDAIARLHPPVGDADDRRALAEAVLDGTLTGVATDHRPLTPEQKVCELEIASPGAIGFETAWALTLGVLGDPVAAVRALSTGPAAVLGRPTGLHEGALADIVVVDTDSRWTPGPETSRASQQNSPWWGRELCGRVRGTWVGGRPVTGV